MNDRASQPVYVDCLPGHPTLKTFVFDYYAQIDRSRVSPNQPAPAPVSAVATR
jgi:hypothetical protein